MPIWVTVSSSVSWVIDVPSQVSSCPLNSTLRCTSFQVCRCCLVHAGLCRRVGRVAEQREDVGTDDVLHASFLLECRSDLSLKPLIERTEIDASLPRA